MMTEPDRPIPSSIFSMGPPKHAENPIIGAKEAMLVFATRSASEFPMAKMVKPIMASDNPKMRPNA